MAAVSHIIIYRMPSLRRTLALTAVTVNLNLLSPLNASVVYVDACRQCTRGNQAGLCELNFKTLNYTTMCQGEYDLTLDEHVANKYKTYFEMESTDFEGDLY